MSHELRTPLNAILGFNEMILGDIYGDVPDDLKVPLTDIQTSGKHLLRLINNVLDLSKIEAGRMELALADYSVQDIVVGLPGRPPLPGNPEGRWTSSPAVPDDIPLAYGDGGRITQCLLNLAGNALKFTREGRIEIASSSQATFSITRVTDTGTGIAADRLEDGLRASSDRQTPPSPASSAAPGSDSASRRNSSRCTAGASGWRASSERDRRSRSRSRCGWTEWDGMSAKTILYVEDNELNRKIVRDLLRRTSYRLIEAVDGEAGIATALEAAPGPHSHGLQLPKVSGIDAVRALRQRRQRPRSRSSPSRRSRSAGTSRRPRTPAPPPISPSRTARSISWA